MLWVKSSRMNTILTGVLLMGLLVTGVPALAQDESPVETPDATAAGIAVVVQFGSDVDRASRALVGESTEFAAEGFSAEEGTVFCLTRINNMSAPATVTHVWYHEGKTMARVELTVGASHWRTWSSKRILPAWTGNWEVKVLDADGMVLATGGFTVQ